MMKLSKLRIEENRIWPEDCKYTGYDNCVPKEGYPVWRVFVDDKCLSEIAQTFKSTDDSIELYTDICFPIPYDGSGYVKVRRLGSYVFWFGEFAVYYYLADDVLPTDWAYVFDAKHYEDVIGVDPEPDPEPIKPTVQSKGIIDRLISLLRGQTKSDVLSMPIRPINREIPKLSHKELQHHLSAHFPKPDNALYRFPKDDNDRLGRALLRRARMILYLSGKRIAEPYHYEREQDLQTRFLKGELGEISVCEPPDQWTEFQVGVEDDGQGVIESIWRVGRIETGVAVLFVQNPYFPVWLCGDGVSEIFEGMCVG